MDKIGLKRFFYFQFVSKDNVKDVFRLTLYKSKPNKLLIFNGVIKIKRLGGCTSGADSVSVLGPFFQVRFSKMAQNAAFGLKL